MTYEKDWDFKIVTKRGFTFMVWQTDCDRIKYMAQMESPQGWMTQGRNFKDLICMMDDLSDMALTDTKEKTE